MNIHILSNSILKSRQISNFKKIYNIGLFNSFDQHKISVNGNRKLRLIILFYFIYLDKYILTYNYYNNIILNISMIIIMIFILINIFNIILINNLMIHYYNVL